MDGDTCDRDQAGANIKTGWMDDFIANNAEPFTILSPPLRMNSE